MKRLSPIPPKAMMKARWSKNEMGGRDGPDFSFILSKIVVKVNPGLKVNLSINFSCMKIFFTLQLYFV